MSDPTKDRLSLERMRAGDLRALEELYDRHNGLLYSVALRILKNPAQAEEATQDAWVRIRREAGAYDEARGTVGAWLVGITRDRAIERLRAGVTPSDTPHPIEDASANAAHRQMSERVGRALDKLGPQHRQVLELAYYGGMAQSEIASRLNETPATIRSWTRQGLIRLSELVPQEEWT